MSRESARPPTPRVITTRDEPGTLDILLRDAGIEAVAVPMIEIVDSDGDALRAVLERLDSFDWLVVTSRHGARRVGDAAGAVADVRLAAVGSATAAVLAELARRPVDLVPNTHHGDALVEAFPAGDRSERILIAQADRADDTVAEGLRARGYDVEVVTAYRTQTRMPSDTERQAVLGAVGVTFASGSAVHGWHGAFGTATPPLVAVIGPSTARVAGSLGLQVTAVAADHSVDGLAATVIDALRPE